MLHFDQQLLLIDAWLLQLHCKRLWNAGPFRVRRHIPVHGYIYCNWSDLCIELKEDSQPLTPLV
jgi:hypothetical protein